jgi:hypothetical protein
MSNRCRNNHFPFVICYWWIQLRRATENSEEYGTGSGSDRIQLSNRSGFESRDYPRFAKVGISSLASLNAVATAPVTVPSGDVF